MLVRPVWTCLLACAGCVPRDDESVNAAQICRLFDMHPVAIVGSKDKAKFVQENYNLEPAQAILIFFCFFLFCRLPGQGQVFVKKKLSRIFCCARKLQ
jgi:hypothetical protein